MDWNRGFSASYYIKTVDPATWRDLDTYQITAGDISRSVGSLKESASVDMTEIPEGPEAWIRIYLDARQGATGERPALFTGLMSIPETAWDGSCDSYSCECYSVLKAADDIKLPRGWYAPAGGNGADIAADLLKGAAPVEVADSSPLLASAIIAENNESRLSMAEKITDAINWRIRISGDGTISIEPKETEPRASFDTIENDIIELEVTDRKDLFDCPNVFRATADDLTAIARDDDPESPLSTVSRGREIWMDENNVKLADNESIAQYAMRRLKEEQAPAREVEYTRRFWPDITAEDVISLNLPAQKITGTFRIESQKITLGYGARISEEVIEL